MTRRRRPTPSPARSVMSPSDDEEDYDKLEDEYEPHVDVQPTKPWSPEHAGSPNAPGTSLSIANFLPHEILVHIFKKLSSKDDQHATLLVSRAWCQCSVELLWHKLSVSNLASLLQMMHIITRKDQTFQYASFIRRLNFSSHSAGMTDEIFVRLAPCVRLERLTLAGCSLLTDQSLIAVFSACPALVAVDLSGVTEATDASIIALAKSTIKLQGINLTRCKKVTDEGVLALAESAPLLRRIKLHGLVSLTDVSVSAIARRCPLLLEIDLSNCTKITEETLRNIWQYQTHLRELQLSNISNLTDDAFPSPPPVVPLRAGLNSLAILPTASATELALELPPLLLSHPFDHLRVLDLTACSHLTDAGLDGIVSNCPKIRHIVLAKCTALTDDALISIGKLGKNVHYVHLGHVSNITDRGVTQMAQACPRIRYIDLGCCGNLTDLSVLELASLSKLRRVGLVRLPNLTDNAVFALGEKHSALERIHLSYCENISVGAIHFLLQRLSKLTHLSLTGIPQFRRLDLREYCRPPPKEFNQHQRLAFCVFSGKGVTDLRKYLQGLAMRAMDIDREQLLEDGQDTIVMGGEVEEPDTEGDDDTPGDESIVWPPPSPQVAPVLHAPQPQHPRTTHGASSSRPHVNGAGGSRQLQSAAAGSSRRHRAQEEASPDTAASTSHHRQRTQSAPRQAHRDRTPPGTSRRGNINSSDTSRTSSGESGTATVAGASTVGGTRDDEWEDVGHSVPSSSGAATSSRGRTDGGRSRRDGRSSGGRPSTEERDRSRHTGRHVHRDTEPGSSRSPPTSPAQSGRGASSSSRQVSAPVGSEASHSSVSTRLQSLVAGRGSPLVQSSARQPSASSSRTSRQPRYASSPSSVGQQTGRSESNGDSSHRPRTSSQESLPTDLDRELALSLEAALRGSSSRNMDGRGRGPREGGGGEGRRNGGLRNTFGDLFGRGGQI